jgi:hypothetical protein
LCDEEMQSVLVYIIKGVPPEMMKPFIQIRKSEISNEDKKFVLGIMKLDPRDRTIARELLEDDWFTQG